MTLEEFKKLCEDDDFAPGWDEIEDAFKEVYGDTQPEHYGTNIQSRAMFGGPEYLDGFSAYPSPKGYSHIVTFGMSELYADEESFGGEFSKWGYEMTFKLKDAEPNNCVWAMNMLGNLARYTFQSKSWFEDGQYIGNIKDPRPIIADDKDTLITSLLITNDTEIKGRDTIYGRLDFIQLVGITTDELLKIRENKELIPTLIENLKADYPDLETDMRRTKNYI